MTSPALSWLLVLASWVNAVCATGSAAPIPVLLIVWGSFVFCAFFAATRTA